MTEAVSKNPAPPYPPPQNYFDYFALVVVNGQSFLWPRRGYRTPQLVPAKELA